MRHDGQRRSADGQHDRAVGGRGERTHSPQAVREHAEQRNRQHSGRLGGAPQTTSGEPARAQPTAGGGENKHPTARRDGEGGPGDRGEHKRGDNQQQHTTAREQRLRPGGPQPCHRLRSGAGHLRRPGYNVATQAAKPLELVPPLRAQRSDGAIQRQ